MKNESSNNSEFNSLSLLLYVYKWRKPLIILCVSAVVISSIISLTIQSKYKSTVILFPGVTYSNSKALIANNPYRPDVNQFGDEEEAEQMLQILNSNEVREKICKKYNLFKHYGIDSASTLGRTALYDEYNSNINFERTKYMSVKIDVLDAEPEIASKIANDIASFHDSARYNIQKQRALVAYSIIEREYLAKQKEVNEVHDSLRALNALGIVDIEQQSRATSEELAKAIGRNDQNAIKSLKAMFDILTKYSSTYIAIKDKSYYLRLQLSDLKSKYDEAKLDLETILPQKFIVSAAEPAQKKSYPVRWIIVMVSTLSTLFIGILLIFIIENFRQLKGGWLTTEPSKKEVKREKEDVKLNFKLPEFNFFTSVKQEPTKENKNSKHEEKEKEEEEFNYFEILMKNNRDNNYFMIDLVMKYKLHFIIVFAAAAIISSIFSSPWFIKPKFKSNAIVYPSNLISYSDESPSEQMLQLMQASEVRENIIKKFNLAKHYGIDTTKESAKTALINEYESNINIKRTQYESIEIEVMDTEPKMARDMVLEVINGVNLKARSLQREKTQEVLNMYTNQLKFKRKQVDSLNAILQSLRTEFELLDYSIQTEEGTKAYLKALADGRKENSKEAGVLLKNLQEKGGLYFQTAKSYEVALSSYNNTKIEFDNTYRDLNKELTYTNVVVKPFIADKKSYPVRWLIVSISVMSSLALLLITLLVFQRGKKTA